MAQKELSTYEYAEQMGVSASNVSRNARFKNYHNLPGVASIKVVGNRYILIMQENYDKKNSST